MKMLRPVLRRFFPKQYVKMMLNRLEEERKALLKSKKNISELDLHRHITDIDAEIAEFQEWHQEILDNDLLSRASKMGIYIDDIPLPTIAGDWRDKHFEVG